MLPSSGDDQLQVHRTVLGGICAFINDEDDDGEDDDNDDDLLMPIAPSGA